MILLLFLMQVTGHSGLTENTVSSTDPISIPPNKRILSTRSFPSDDWFQELDKLNSVLRVKPKERHGPYQPVKIAILDTGVSEDFADFVKGYKDFVSNDDYNWQDNTGHGTNAVRLIQKVYNMAEIYIGRVFEAHRATANTATLMAQLQHVALTRPHLHRMLKGL